MNKKRSFRTDAHYARAIGNRVYAYNGVRYSKYDGENRVYHEFRDIKDGSMFTVWDDSDEEMRYIPVCYAIGNDIPVVVKITDIFVNADGRVCYEVSAKNHYRNNEIYA